MTGASSKTAASTTARTISRLLQLNEGTAKPLSKTYLRNNRGLDTNIGVCSNLQQTACLSKYFLLHPNYPGQAGSLTFSSGPGRMRRSPVGSCSGSRLPGRTPNDFRGAPVRRHALTSQDFNTRVSSFPPFCASPELAPAGSQNTKRRKRLRRPRKEPGVD